MAFKLERPKPNRKPSRNVGTAPKKPAAPRRSTPAPAPARQRGLSELQGRGFSTPPVVQQQFRAAAAPSGGGYASGGGGGYAAASASVPAPAPVPEPAEPKMSYDELKNKVKDFDWLRGQDANFAAAEAGYKKVLDQLTATIGRENKDYDAEAGKALKSLGVYQKQNRDSWDWNKIDDDVSDDIAFDWNNQDTAAGRSRTNLQDDFAARGMLQGSGFADSLNSLSTSLTDQTSNLVDTRRQFSRAQSEKQNQGKETFNTNLQLAAANALERMAQALGIV